MAVYYGTRTAAVPPAESIREALEARGLSQREFALRMGMCEKQISLLLNNKSSLTPETALRLETVFGVSASYWNNLEAAYREDIARVDEERSAEEEGGIARLFQYAKLAKHGLVPLTRALGEQVRNLRSFFEVVRLSSLEELMIPGIAYRVLGPDSRDGEHTPKDYLAAAWSQKVRIVARSIETRKYEQRTLERALPSIRALSTRPPAEYMNELPHLLASKGVAYVLYPHVEGAYMNGASFHDGKKVVLGVTTRCNRDDIFWFNLFHELGHILHRHIDEPTSPEHEEDANRFAADQLIAPEALRAFIAGGAITKARICSFASEIDIAPGIVVGRLQNDKMIPQDRFNNLKRKLVA